MRPHSSRTPLPFGWGDKCIAFVGVCCLLPISSRLTDYYYCKRHARDFQLRFSHFTCCWSGAWNNQSWTRQIFTRKKKCCKYLLIAIAMDSPCVCGRRSIYCGVRVEKRHKLDSTGSEMAQTKFTAPGKLRCRWYTATVRAHGKYTFVHLIRATPTCIIGANDRRINFSANKNCLLLLLFTCVSVFFHFFLSICFSRGRISHQFNGQFAFAFV